MKNEILKIVRKIYHGMPFYIKEIILFLYKKYNWFKKNNYPKIYPLKASGKILVGEPFLENSSGYGYYGFFYKEAFFFDTDNPMIYNMLKYEIYLAKESNEIDFAIDSESIIPIAIKNSRMFTDKKSSINIKFKFNNKIEKIKVLPQNRYNYFKFDKNVTIYSDAMFYIADPILLTQKKLKKNEKKLVVVLFFDALTGDIINNKLSDIMPNTSNFFKEGIIFKNCYSNSEYTYTSLASIFSGKYVKNIDFFNVRSKEDELLGKNFKIFSEYFHNQDYYTTLISGNNSQNPYSGYSKGFDRTIYRNHLKAEEIFNEFYESSKLFAERDSFYWLSFLDTHHLIDYVPSIDVQADMNLSDYEYKINGEDVKTPFSLYSKSSTERYKKNLTKIDDYLKDFYKYLKDNYKDNEYTVVFLSDHAASSTIDIDHAKHITRLLKSEKLHVPLMIKDSQFKGAVSNELMENVDILPTLLELTNIKYNISDFDGRTSSHLGGASREYVFAESIYPKQTYKATIKTREIEFFLEAEHYTGEDGLINLGNYETFNIGQVDYEKNKLKIFEEKILNHIKKS